MSVLPPAAVLGLLVWAMVTDLCERRIANAVPAGIALLWLAQVMLIEGDTPSWQTGLGVLAVCALALVAWRLGWLGGGDVKLLGALALWAADTALVPFLLLTGLLGGCLALLWSRLAPVSAVLPGACHAWCMALRTRVGPLRSPPFPMAWRSRSQAHGSFTSAGFEL